MKYVAVTLSLAVITLLALGQFSPDNAAILARAAGAAGVALLVVVLLLPNPSNTTTKTLAAAQANQVSASDSNPGSDSPQRANAEVISFLAALQEKGRLVDFLMDDVTSYDDAQVGAAARVVHEGCRAALHEVFTIAPVTESPEGTTISVPESYRADEYSLTGKLSGQPPFNGTVVHRGWKTTQTKLPQIIVPDGDLPCIAPAQIEVQG